MRFSIAASAALVASAAAGYVNTNATAVTEVVTAYTTFCPGPTTITHGTKTYTVTSATTLTITDCPCTITRPITTSTVSKCYNCPTPPAGTGAVPPPPVNPPVYPNATGVQPNQPPQGTGKVTGTGPSAPHFTGAAARVVAGAGAGLAGVLGLAFLL
ncbi:hypothetical protein PRK78_003377 [Emydomyces testavorans]|uniref:Clock-controlled protein 6 n=1 Tax=Emydomyces testavorans TaxID=2070801 RepID=A0AAF0IHE7_9EURO|nr:hypothetical protein PRK78_003377 [Emydomyces testavorans]